MTSRTILQAWTEHAHFGVTSNEVLRTAVTAVSSNPHPLPPRRPPSLRPSSGITSALATPFPLNKNRIFALP